MVVEIENRYRTRHCCLPTGNRYYLQYKVPPIIQRKEKLSMSATSNSQVTVVQSCNLQPAAIKLKEIFQYNK